MADRVVIFYRTIQSIMVDYIFDEKMQKVIGTKTTNRTAEQLYPQIYLLKKYKLLTIAILSVRRNQGTRIGVLEF